jgi:hypothetical protein
MAKKIHTTVISDAATISAAALGGATGIDLVLESNGSAVSPLSGDCVRARFVCLDEKLVERVGWTEHFVFEPIVVLSGDGLPQVFSAREFAGGLVGSDRWSIATAIALVAELASDSTNGSVFALKSLRSVLSAGDVRRVSKKQAAAVTIRGTRR